MRRPEWIKEAPELVECLLQVRDVGVWDMRLRRLAIGPLEDVARAICPRELHGDQHRLIAKALESAIPRMPRVDYQKAADILFDLRVDRRGRSSTERRAEAGRLLHQSLSRFRHPELGFERPLLLSVAEEIQRLAAEFNAPDTADPLLRYEELGVLPENIMITRSLFHVARTLATRKRYATMQDALEIDSLLKRYASWHTAKAESGVTLLESFDSLCRKYIGLSVFDLLGQLESRSPAPEYPPHQQIPGLRYPKRQSLALVDGGRDVFTGEMVTPFFMSYFPVTIMEWSDFLAKFGWESSLAWDSLIPHGADLSATGLGRLPAVAMTYFDCVAFCFWLWLTTPYRFRLPTEAEWNFAATAGANRRYPWGEYFDTDYANVAESGKPQAPLPVDLALSSGPFDIVGLAGNAWEYTSTLWRGDTPQENSEIDIPDLMFPLIMPHWWSADTRVLRGSEGDVPDEEQYLHDVKVVMKGGSWSLGPEYATVATRIYSSLFNLGEYGGFRLAVSAIKDSSTNHFVPEPSPFVSRHLTEVRSISVDDMRNLVADYYLEQAAAHAVGSGCGGGSGPSTKLKSWEEIVRERSQASY